MPVIDLCENKLRSGDMICHCNCVYVIVVLTINAYAFR